MKMEIKSKIIKTKKQFLNCNILHGYFYFILFCNNCATLIVKHIFTNLFWTVNPRFTI